MYIHPVTRANKKMMKKMTESMTSQEIKQSNKDHAKKRKIINQRKNKYNNKNKINLNEMM